MITRLLTLLPLAAALAATPMLAQAQSQGEDLLKAYSQALANDPTLAQQQAQRDLSGEAVPQTRAGLLPTLSAGLSFNQSNTYGSVVNNVNGVPVKTSATGHTRSRGVSVTLSQTVLDMSKFADLSAAHARVDSANATYRANLQNLIVRVTTTYFDVLTAKDQVEFNQANVNALKRQSDQAEQRYKAGLTAITDLQDAKSEYDSALAQLIVAKNQLNDAREALSEITGQPVQNLEVLSDKLPMSPPQPNKLSTWVNQAQTNNPNIIAQQFSVDAAEDSITAAREARLPTISAHVSYNTHSAAWSEAGGYQRDLDGASVGLSLNVPLFSGGLIRSQVRSSIYQRDSAQAGLVQQRRKVVRDTRNYFRSVNSGISQIEAAKQALISSRSALEANRAGLLAGTQTITQVLIAQSNLIRSQQQYSQARHQFILNKLLLKQAAGNLTLDDLKHVNALLEPQTAAVVAPAAEDGMPAAAASSQQP